MFEFVMKLLMSLLSPFLDKGFQCDDVRNCAGSVHLHEKPTGQSLVAGLLDIGDNRSLPSVAFPQVVDPQNDM